MTSTEQSGTSVFFNTDTRHAEFGTPVPEDEKLHRSFAETETSPDLVETQFFGFSIPEKDIMSMSYLWVHPNLRVLGTNAWVWKGVGIDPLQSEIFDARDLHPIAPVWDDGDLDGFQLDNGYSVEIVDPLEKIRIRYSDPARDNAYDVVGTAIMPPAMISSGTHFEQAMKMEGTLRLRGVEHRIDCFHVRDRSWGETRPENPRTMPPLSWTSPVFGDDFALNVTGFDDPRHKPLWEGLFPFGPEQVDAFNRGWVWRDGELRGVAKTSMRTEWDRRTGYPVAQHLDLTDSTGREYSMTGTVTAVNNWHTWSNMRAAMCLARWECEGRTGWGDIQAVSMTDFFRHLID